MRPQRVYIDTSVIGGCLDQEFEAAGLALIESARRDRIVLLVSELLLMEPSLAPSAVMALVPSLPPGAVEEVPESFEALHLRDAYLAARVVGAASANDELHVATATVARADVIASWNFKHIVHIEKIRGFNAVNLMEGYSPIDIRSPLEVV